MQQNSKYWLYSDRHETINHMISECSILAQKEYKIRHDWVDKVIHWGLCKKLKLTIRSNGTCTTNYLSWRMRHINSNGILTYKWNMKMRIIPIAISAFGTVTKRLLRGLEDFEIKGRAETIQTTTLLRTTRILRRVLKTWEDLLSLKLLWKTIS